MYFAKKLPANSVNFRISEYYLLILKFYEAEKILKSIINTFKRNKLKNCKKKIRKSPPL